MMTTLLKTFGFIFVAILLERLGCAIVNGDSWHLKNGRAVFNFDQIHQAKANDKKLTMTHADKVL